MHNGLEIVNPLTYPGWDDLVLAHEKGSFFHSAAWARVLQESYGYRPVYFASISGGRIEALFPLMEIDSPFTGKRGVSLPFTDYCEPIVPDGVDVFDMVNQINSFGKGSGWKSVEYRSGGTLSEGLQPSSTYLGHSLELSSNERSMYQGLHESTSRNVRKAQKQGVTAIISESPDAMEEFYRLNCITRKMHGLPPQPLRFFEALQRNVISRGFGVIALADHGGTVPAASLFLVFGGKAMYKYGASDKRHKHLKANNIVMWEAITSFAANGYKSLCFGRTEPENSGLLQFKRGWGAEEYTLDYFKYDLKRGGYVTEQSRLRGFHNAVFSKMPIPLLKLTGTLLYRHIG